MKQGQKFYVGFIQPDGERLVEMRTMTDDMTVVRGEIDESYTGEPLDLRLDLMRHSPTGFAWGYGGSGPAQLALAMLADALGDDREALRIYQRFKEVLIARLPGDEGFAISANLVRIVSQWFGLE